MAVPVSEAVVIEEVPNATTANGSPQSPSHLMPPPFEEQPRPKLKGRQRLLAGLQRISSSQSVNRLGGSRSRGYSGSGIGSISCISLNSASSFNTPSFGPSLTREYSYGFSTAPTSTVTTPGVQIPPFDERARVRYLSKSDGKDSAAIPAELRPASRAGLTPGTAEATNNNSKDYFSRSVAQSKPRPRKEINFWRDLPFELKMETLSYLTPREVVRCSSVSKTWHEMCFDGQLWSILDTAGFYQDIPADALVNIILSAGPFVRDLNLRGCVQLRERWHAKGLSDACRNLENFSLEGCRIDRTAIHNFLYKNNRLVHINLCGLSNATNSAMKILATNCPKLEHLNVSWCTNMDTRGLRKVVEGCPNLKDLRASEIIGWDDIAFARLLFEKNTLERLILINCDTLSDESLTVIMEGVGNEIDYLTGRAIVPPRKLRHLDLTRCRGISDKGLRSFVNNLPELEGLQLSRCRGVLDATLIDILPTVPMLTHLDLEELEDLTNAVLQCLATAPCTKRLRHLSISYCENLGDTGMLPVVKACTNLRSLEMDNTRVSDLVLTEAAAMVKHRISRTVIRGDKVFQPEVGLNLVAYDCQNVTWTGVREILHRNAEIFVNTHAQEMPPLPAKSVPSANSATPSSSSSATSLTDHLTVAAAASSTMMPTSRPATPAPSPAPPRIHIVRTTSYPTQIISLKCFYTYQPTVEEHTKRVRRGDFLAAKRLERKWAEFMIAQEEAGARGAGSRRRRRRAREAQMLHADEEVMGEEEEAAAALAALHGGAGVGGHGVNGGSGVGGGRRRRARSGGCGVM